MVSKVSIEMSEVPVRWLAMAVVSIVSSVLEFVEDLAEERKDSKDLVNKLLVKGWPQE